jgi:hypothetical protein
MNLSCYPTIASLLEWESRYPTIAAVLADLPAKDRSAHKQLFRRNFIPVSRRTPERIAWDFRAYLEHHLDEYPELKLTAKDIITQMKMHQRETRGLTDIWKWLIKWKIVKKTSDPNIFEIIPE